VAGAVAELSWLDELDEGTDAEAWEEPDMMSFSDWELAGCTPGFPDETCMKAIKKVAILLARGGLLWPDLLQEARELIVDSRTQIPPAQMPKRLLAIRSGLANSPSL
jgi:hypothetical protein